MLVLSRHRDECVIIGEGDDAVLVTVVDIRGDKIRLGFSANPEISIDRLEVREIKDREKREREFRGDTC